MEEYTTIRISPITRDVIKGLGRKAQSYDEILVDILDHVEFCDRFWQNRT